MISDFMKSYENMFLFDTVFCVGIYIVLYFELFYLSKISLFLKQHCFLLINILFYENLHLGLLFFGEKNASMYKSFLDLVMKSSAVTGFYYKLI